MSCALTQGQLVLDCRDIMGGVKSIYVIEFDNVSGVTSVDGVVTVIGKANNKRFWKYNLPRSTAEASEEFNDNLETGTVFYKQTINMVINKMQASTRNEIVILGQARLMMVVEDRQATPKFWLYGKENGLVREGGKAGTGKAPADRNGYELIFTAEEASPALEVSSGIISGLEVP